MYPQNSQKYKHIGRKTESCTEKCANFLLVLVLKTENAELKIKKNAFQATFYSSRYRNFS